MRVRSFFFFFKQRLKVRDTYSCSGLSHTTFVTAFETVVKIVANIVQAPSDARYRRVRLTNPSLHERLFTHAGGIAVLKCVWCCVLNSCVILLFYAIFLTNGPIFLIFLFKFHG
jgi:hypothetical protein